MEDEGMAAAERDDEFLELVASVGRRRAALLLTAARAVAEEIRADADRLGTQSVTPRNSAGLTVLHRLPVAVRDQSKFWRYQLAAGADRLGDDITRWGAPVPRCTGEEMVLHIILRRARAADPRATGSSPGWDLLAEILFQDHDVLMLYDMDADAAEEIAGAVNLAPQQWFTEFTLPFPVPERDQ